MNKILIFALTLFIPFIAQSALQTDIDNREILEEINNNLNNAIYNDNPELVREAITQGANLEKRDRHGQTPLLIASWRSFNTAKILIDAKADVNAIDYHDQTPLDAAARNRYLILIQALLEAKALVNDPRLTKRRLLHWNISTFSNPNVIKILLDHNADYNEENNNSETVIQNAYKQSIIQPESKNYSKIVSLITDFSKKKIEEFLKIAQVYPKKISKLIAHFAFGLEDKNNLDYNKLLTDTVKYKKEYYALNKVKAALAHGANIDFVQPNDFERNCDLYTPLMLAICNCETEVVEYLIKAKANVNYKNRHEDTPLHTAVNEGRVDIVKTLIDSKALINVINCNGNQTPLSIALSFPSWCEKEKKLILELLLINGAEYEQFFLDNKNQKLISEILVPEAPKFIIAATRLMPPLAKIIAKLAFGVVEDLQ